MRGADALCTACLRDGLGQRHFTVHVLVVPSCLLSRLLWCTDRPPVPPACCYCPCSFQVVLGDRDQNATLARLQYYTRYLTQRDSRRQASSGVALGLPALLSRPCRLACLLLQVPASLRLPQPAFRPSLCIWLGANNVQSDERKLRRMMDATSGQGRPMDSPTDTALGELPASLVWGGCCIPRTGCAARLRDVQL